MKDLWTQINFLFPILLLLLFSSFTSSTLIVNETLSYPTYEYAIAVYTECIQQDDVQGIVQFMYCNSTLDELVPQPQPQQYNYIILLIGGNCESHVLESFIENEKVAAVLVLDNQNPTVYDEFIDYRECWNPSNPPTMKQLQYMPTKNASIIEEQLHNGDLVILTWEPNPFQTSSAHKAIRIYGIVLLVIWTILLASGLVLLALALKRGEIRSNIQTFVYVGILLIEIARVILFAIPFAQNDFQNAIASRVLLYFTNFVGFSLFSILAFNWLKIALLTLQYKDAKVWQILKIVLIACCTIVDLLLFISIFSIFYSESIHRVIIMFVIAPIGFLFLLVFGIVFAMIYRTLAGVQNSKKSFALKKITLFGVIAEIGILLVVIATFVVFSMTPYQGPITRLGPYTFFEFSIMFLLSSLYILVGYQQKTSQMRTSDKSSSKMKSDPSQEMSTLDTAVQEMVPDQY